MYYEQFTKKLVTPAGFTVPKRLRFEPFNARAISRADLSDDVRGINASLELIARTRGGGWPTEPVTAAVDFVDLVWHELEFRDRYSFTYTVYDTGGTTSVAAICTHSAAAPSYPKPSSTMTSTSAGG